MALLSFDGDASFARRDAGAAPLHRGRSLRHDRTSTCVRKREDSTLAARNIRRRAEGDRSDRESEAGGPAIQA